MPGRRGRDTKKEIPLAFGAGVNSTALAILMARQGWRGPVVFCDTGAEWPGTYEFISTFSSWLKTHYDLSLIVLGGEYRYDRFRLPLPEYCRKYETILWQHRGGVPRSTKYGPSGDGAGKTVIALKWL